MTFSYNLCIINIGNGETTNVVLPRIYENSHQLVKVTDVSFFYLCSCLSTQFLYRTAVKATFNVKDNIKDIIKNSIALTINITTLPTKIRKIGGKNHICLFSFPMSVSITYILQQSNKNKQIFVIFFLEIHLIFIK